MQSRMAFISHLDINVSYSVTLTVRKGKHKITLHYTDKEVYITKEKFITAFDVFISFNVFFLTFF